MVDSHRDNLRALLDVLHQSGDEREQNKVILRLRQRARAYAAPQRREDSFRDDEVYQVLTFKLGTERYAVDVALVRGVRPRGRLTRLPGVPAYYRGLVNVRGQIISVLDLRAFFQMTGDLNLMPIELLVVETSSLTLALLADHIEEVIAVPKVTVEPVDMRYARGVTSDKLVILDIAALFEDERLIIGGEKTR